jgi:type II secretory pathway predicted ATPase ExeA
MFESFYGLKEDPFSIRPDPAFLLLTRQHQRALSVLQYGLEARAGFTVVTGAVGTGKTTLIRRLFQMIDKQYTTGLVSNAQDDSFEELLQWILLAFGLEYKGKSKVELYETFTDFLVEERVNDRSVALVIDEAQHLGPRTLEQLRMLSNVNADKEDLLQMILVGQPGLRDLLLRQELFQFAQRIIADCHLEPLDAEETDHYVRHRIEVAGGKRTLFTVEALNLVWKYTGGVPRLINTLCGMALVFGFADQQAHIDGDLVREVVTDKKLGLSPIGGHRAIKTRATIAQLQQSDTANAPAAAGTEHGDRRVTATGRPHGRRE